MSRLARTQGVQFAVVTAVVALCGCDRATSIEGIVRWASADGHYSVEYVAPPWEVDKADNSSLSLQIKPEVFGVALAGAPPTHLFTLGPVDPTQVLSDLLDDYGDAVLNASSGSLEIGTGGLPDELPDALDTGGEDLPLPGVDLSDPRAVALAELDYLVTKQDADLVTELAQAPIAAAPWMYEVTVPPGLQVRGYYYQDGERTLRAMFASVFSLGDGDVSRMAATIAVVAEVP